MVDIIALAAIGGFTLSSLAGTVRRGIEDRRQAKERGLRGPEAVCGCKHHLSFHDAETGQCHAQLQLKLKDADGATVGKETVTCTCRRYVGPEPIGGYFAPEITS